MAENSLAQLQRPQPNALGVAGPMATFAPNRSPVPPRRPRELPPGLVNAVIQQESEGDPNAVSGKGAGGLMGIMPHVWDKPGYGMVAGEAGKRMDPSSNVAFGTALLNAYYNRYGGDITKALMAYNWGPGRVNNWSGNWGDVPSETREYVRDISQMMTGDMETYGAPPFASNRSPAPPRRPL